uniref:Muscle M-line assembly protein unc-89 n=1 Tax=Culex pipiens TaxID=7175 RepID=A0A8D8N5U5_CULPI
MISRLIRVRQRIFCNIDEALAPVEPAKVSQSSEAAITDIPKKTVENQIVQDAPPIPAKNELPSDATPETTTNGKSPEETNARVEQAGYRLKKREPEKSPPLPQFGDDMVKYHHKRILHNRDKLQWSVHLTNRAGLAGRRFKLMCAATGFQAELNWYKDDKLIEYDDHIIDMNDLHRSAYGCIWIEDLRPEDAGVYKCIASNGFEQIETQCKLTVVKPDIEKREFAPVFVPHRTREIYDQTSNILTLEHLIRANPPPTIKWIKGLFTLGMWPDPHIRISQHFDEVAEHSVVSLVFYDPTYKDSGEYICIATNDLGEATSVYNMKYSSEEEYFEWLAKKRPSAKLKRELELGIIVAEDAPTFDVDEILAQVEARMATTSQEEHEDSSSEAETSEDDSSVPKKSAIDKANIRKPDNVTRKSDVKFTVLPNVKEMPELEEEQSAELVEPPKTIEPVKKESTDLEKKTQEQTSEKTATDGTSVTPETLYVRKKTQIELDVEELERRKKFDFVSQMPNSRFELGKTFRIFAYVRCPGDITSEWKHDGRVMKEGLRSSFTTTRNGTCVLEIEKCKYRDAGVYTCVAKSDKFGEIEQSCTISIFENKIKGEKPVFTKNMKESYNPIKDELCLECTVRGDPVPETIWIIHGTFIHKNSGSKYFFRKFDDGRQQLTIFQPKKEDSGRYVCRARNSIDKADMVYYLNWKNSDEEVIKEFENELHKKVDKPIRSRHLRAKECEYKPEDENLLKWSEARNQHEKEYNYNYKLKFITHLQDKTVAEGSNIKFTCYVDGKYPQFMWYKDDMPLVQGRKYRQKQRRDGKVTLEVINVSPDDAGVYKIEAKNYAGVISSQSIVTKHILYIRMR